MDSPVDAHAQNKKEEDDYKEKEKEFLTQFNAFMSTYTAPKPGDKHFVYIQQMKKLHRLASKRPGSPMLFEHYLFVHQKFLEVRERESDMKTPDIFIQEDDGSDEMEEQRVVTPLPTFDDITKHVEADEHCAEEEHGAKEEEESENLPESKKKEADSDEKKDN